jgi:hypothetical protein
LNACKLNGDIANGCEDLKYLTSFLVGDCFPSLAAAAVFLSFAFGGFPFASETGVEAAETAPNIANYNSAVTLFHLLQLFACSFSSCSSC